MTEQQFFRSSGFLLAWATFRTVAEKVLNHVTSTESKRVGVVIDMYRHVSIKNAERSKRECKAADGMKCKNILARYGIKSWSKFLSVSSNKAELVKFLLEQWQSEEFRRLKLSDCTMYVTCEYECRSLNSVGILRSRVWKLVSVQILFRVSLFPRCR